MKVFEYKEPDPEPTPDDDKDDKENNTVVFSLTICSLVIVIGFIFFVICYMKVKRENAKDDKEMKEEELIITKISEKYCR